MSGETIRHCRSRQQLWMPHECTQGALHIRHCQRLRPWWPLPLYVTDSSWYPSKPIAAVDNESFQSAEVPQDWRKAIICPIFETGDQEDAANYRSVRLTPVLRKLFEKLLKKALHVFLTEFWVLFDLIYVPLQGFPRWFAESFPPSLRLSVYWFNKRRLTFTWNVRRLRKHSTQLIMVGWLNQLNGHSLWPALSRRHWVPDLLCSVRLKW